MRSRSMLFLLALMAGLLVFPGVASAQDSAEICDADGLVEAVQGGAEEGTLEGMADDPVATAASNNPVLTTLVAAVSEAGLVDTLNSAEALTVFAPTDCAFAAFDQATLEAAMADPTGLLTQVLGFHVIAGEQIASADLSGEYETFTGEMITVDGTTVGGQAEIVVPDITTANATVHLIDTVMLPPSVTEAAQEDAPAEEMTEGEMADDEMAEGSDEMEATEAPATEAPASGDDGDAPTGAVATGAGGTADGGRTLPLVVFGVLTALVLGGALIARRS